MVEAVISLAIAIIFIIGAFDLMSIVQKTALNTSLSQEGAIHARNNLQNATRLFSENFNATTPKEIQLVTPFSGLLDITDITTCRKEIKSTVLWNTDASRKTNEVTFSSLILSLKNLAFFGGDCGGNDFLNPVSTSSSLQAISLQPPLDLKLTGVDIFKHHAFISAISSSESASDLLTIDIGENFHIVSTIDFGFGVNNLDVASGYLFAAQNSSTSQLAIIDVRSPIAPFLVASTTLPGVAGSRPQGWSIYYYNSKIYIGTKRTAGHEFHIYDVTNPTNPMWLGSREVNHNINSIAVRNGIAYLATSGNVRDVIVLDVSNPANINEKTSLDLPGNEDGKSLYLIGNTLYLGRFKSLNNSNHHDFYALNISDVSHGGLIEILGSYDIHADVNTVRVVGPYAFLGTSDFVREFSVLNISSSTAISFVNNVNLLSKVTGVDYENGNLIISSFDDAEIYYMNLGK